MSLSFLHRLHRSTFFLGSTVIISAIALPGAMLEASTLPAAESRPESIVGRSILYVNPSTGSDSASAGGDELAPLRSITYALERATSGTTIQLGPGEYTAESFPLQLKPGVTLKGDALQQGQGIVIEGGGHYVSSTFLGQNVAIVTADNSEISGITVTNPNVRGTGVWVESTNPTIRNSTFTNNHREGIFVTGSGEAQIENNRFIENGGNGISLAKEAGGEIRGNLFDRTGYGIAVGGDAAPLIANNQIRNNRCGVIATQSARPVLQGNTIENNTEYGVVGLGDAEPIIETDNMMAGNGSESASPTSASAAPAAPAQNQTQPRNRTVKK